MSKRFFTALIAVTALLVAACGKDDKPGSNSSDGPATKTDLVGSWGWNETAEYEFKADGTYTQNQWGESVSGNWELNDGKLSLTPKGGEAWSVNTILTGGKAWLVFVHENEGHKSYENFRKLGATVDSGTLTDGRWDATHAGVAPPAYTKDVSYTVCMVVKGKTIDLYVPMWGYHIQGTFTLSDGRMHIETDDDHIWFGAYMERDGDYGSIGWNAWDAPSDDEELKKQWGWDDSYGSMDPETFELQYPYRYYSVNELKGMGKKPDPNDDEYKAYPFYFKFMIYEWAENVHDNASDLLDFDLCVASNGKEAYGGAVGLCPWFYKR